MTDSFRDMKKVPASLLVNRLETVKPLQESNLDSYEVAKDSTTGEHYLVYRYSDLNLADGTKMTYAHLLPLDHDDVLAIVLDEQPYTYPEHWTRPYLRSSGEDGEEGFVWFDPSEFADAGTFEELGNQVSRRLQEFKRSGSIDPDDVRRLLDELDKLGPK